MIFNNILIWNENLRWLLQKVNLTKRFTRRIKFVNSVNLFSNLSGSDNFKLLVVRLDFVIVSYLWSFKKNKVLIKETYQIVVLSINKNALHARAPLPQWELIFQLDVSYLLSDRQYVARCNFFKLIWRLLDWIIILNNVNWEWFHNISNKQLKILKNFTVNFFFKFLYIHFVNIYLSLNFICWNKYFITILFKFLVDFVNLNIIINSSCQKVSTSKIFKNFDVCDLSAIKIYTLQIFQIDLIIFKFQSVDFD